MGKTINKSKVFLVAATIATLGISTFASAATNSVTMEGKNLVRNATNNEVNYIPSTTAKPGDTLRYMVWYHNTENQDSGKNASNLNIVVSVPGAESSSHITTAVITGSNTNKISQTSLVTTSENTILEYVPGTATRRHNIGTNAAPNWVTESISDSVVGAGYSVSIMHPCWNFEESIVFSVKVKEIEKPTPTPTPTPTPVITGKGNVPLPTSGPAESAAGAAGLTITGGAAYAWLRSKKALLSAITKIK